MKRILIVEDSKTLVSQLEWLLRRERYDVLVAYDGLSALMQVRALMPDLVVLDVMLPNVSGLDVCATIRRNASNPQVPVIIMSALASDEYREQAVEIGADAYLAKPFSNDDLLMTIKQHIYSDIVA